MTIPNFMTTLDSNAPIWLRIKIISIWIQIILISRLAILNTNLFVCLPKRNLKIEGNHTIHSKILQMKIHQ